MHSAYWLLLRRGFRRAEREAYAAQSQRPDEPPPLSVVVAARDEAPRIDALLGALGRQRHLHFEVVFVDDGSVDDTAALIRQWAEGRPHARLLQMPPQAAPGKKRALAAGIAAARHELLAFTDADCAPGPDWLTTLAALHAGTPGETLLVGYAPYRPRRDLLGRLASYETFVTGFLTAAAIGLGRPYMAVGRSLSYSKTLFHRLGGFGRHAHLISGDDDLFVQEAVRRGAARVLHVFGEGAYAPSEAPTSWHAWLRQKRRHLSDGRQYPFSIQLHLGLFHASGLLLWLAPLVAGAAGALLLGGRLGVQAWALRGPAHVFGERALLPRQPLLEVGYALYNLILAPLSLLFRLDRW